MKSKWMYLLAVLFVGMVTGCNSAERDPIAFYFYTSENSEAPWTLYIDGEEVGQLPFAMSAPDCNNPETLDGLLHADISQGSHCYEAKDAEGKLKSHGFFKVRKDEDSQRLRSGSEGVGGASLQWDCDYVSMAVF